MTHDLKTTPEFFEDLYNGVKKFEVRKDDRDFNVGDLLRLREWDNGEPTGQWATFEVDYKLDGGRFGIEAGYCVLGIHRI